VINTIGYGGRGVVEKDGKKIAVPIPPPVVLRQRGPLITVWITHPRKIQEILKEQGKDIASINVKALIDTGASNSVITPKVAETLGLVHTGFQKVASVQDEQDRPVFYGFVGLPWGMGKEIPLVSCPLKNFDCLLGRDILEHWCLTYNGRDGYIIICD
jgi:predicted aspartyl protease